MTLFNQLEAQGFGKLIKGFALRSARKSAVGGYTGELQSARDWVGRTEKKKCSPERPTLRRQKSVLIHS